MIKTTSALERLRELTDSHESALASGYADHISPAMLDEIIAAFEDEQRERERYDEGINRRWLQRDERDAKIRALLDDENLDSEQFRDELIALLDT